MSNHTPGPWIYDGDYVWSDPAQCYVANPKTEDMLSGDIIARRDASKQIDANAMLISAAPDLLASLKDVMLWIKNWSPDFTYDPDWPIDRDRAEAAIAKAETSE